MSEDPIEPTLPAPDFEPPSPSESTQGPPSMAQLGDGGEDPVSVEDGDGASQMPYFVVGIGASAGGVEAVLQVVQNLTADTGMSFIVISHLPPDYRSQLASILGGKCSLPTREIVHGERPEPNHIYCAAGRQIVTLRKGVFNVEPWESRSEYKPIDVLFASLARTQQNLAVGVVLSGMDGDGAAGLKSIKAEGGITIVQSPSSARFPEMPEASVSSECADIIIPPDQIAQELIQLARQYESAALKVLNQAVSARTLEQDSFGRILAQMRTVAGVDFRLYKPTTIRRRIARRMLMHRIDTLANYLLFLQGNTKELGELHEDALINVTSFFRDPDVYDALKSQIFPAMLGEKGPEQHVRIWVAGCSTGEEVYSIAICLLEYLTGSAVEPIIQIFGTDASEQNVQRARSGLYLEAIANEISPERLRRFFVKTEKGYQVAKRVRDLCIFARQNLCHDPPFSRLDLISCRNVLIYFGIDLQRQIIPTFHYALRPDGYLLLGMSETIREFTDLFVLRDRRYKIYSRTGSALSRPTLDVTPRLPLADPPEARVARETESWGDLELRRAADRVILARYAPPGVVVNDRLEIVLSLGHTGSFLEIPPGRATLDLTRMAKEHLTHHITTAVRRAVAEDVPVQVRGLQISEEGKARDVVLEVLPIHATTTARVRYFLVLFVPAPREEGGIALVDEEQRPRTPDENERQLTQLTHDLASTRLYLQSLLEERDAKNQELVSANEEIQSANEELQSTNEELETTKEELQSSNEELQTVNDELQNRNAVLTQASNDLANLLNSVNLPVLMLSNDFAIRHFTPPTQRLMNLRSSDVGRPFGEIRSNLQIDNLEPLFAEVLDSLTGRELEVQDREGHWYLLRIRPYRTSENRIEGLVVVLVDIDQLRRSQMELREARDFARSIIEGITLPLVVIDSDFRIRYPNEAFGKLAGVSRQELGERLLPDVTTVLWGLDQPLRSHLTEYRAVMTEGTGFAFEHALSGQNPRFLSIRLRALRPDGESFMLVTFEDITAHKEIERLLKAESERLANVVATTTKELGRSREELRALSASLMTAQEDERRRVAGELHDDICQRMAALGFDLNEIRHHVDDGASVRGALDALREKLTGLSEDVRKISHQLHPSGLEDLGLVSALRALTNEFGRREEMITTFFAQEVSPSIEISTGLYRIAQEALRNVSKHAGKTHVKVSLSVEGGALQLQVKDFGLGFDMSDGTRSGLGFVMMEERARLMNAKLRVTSELGKGTEITVDVPLEENQ